MCNIIIGQEQQQKHTPKNNNKTKTNYTTHEKKSALKRFKYQLGSNLQFFAIASKYS